MVSDTLGMSQLTALRGTSISTAGDDDAVLSISGADLSADVPTITNNSTSQMELTLSTPTAGVEFDVGATGVWEQSPIVFSLAPSEQTLVEYRGEPEVTVDIESALYTNGERVGTIELQRTFRRPQSSQIELTPNVTSVGNSGKYAFELENTGDIAVQIVGIGVNATSNPDADAVSNGQIFTATGYGQLVTQPIPVDSEYPSEDTRRDLTGSVEMAVGAAQEFELDRFQSATGGNAKMKGEIIIITLYFSDGSDATVELSDE